jgi:hypothetical protein
MTLQNALSGSCEFEGGEQIELFLVVLLIAGVSVLASGRTVLRDAPQQLKGGRPAGAAAMRLQPHAHHPMAR